MKSSTKKLDKLLGNKPRPVSTKNSINLAPHVTYGVTSPVTTAASSNSKKNSRNFAMTVSFYNPKYEGGYPKDYSIRHEDKKQKSFVMNSPSRAKSPKRDPILLNNDEPVLDFKPRIKMFAESRTMAMVSEKPSITQKSLCGDFNQSVHPRMHYTKIEQRRPDVKRLDESSDTGQYRRLRTATKSPIKNLYNTITEGGDPQSWEKATRRRHIAPHVSEQNLRLNDFKLLRNVDRRVSPTRGKMFRDSSIEITDASFLDRSSMQKPIRERHASPEQVRGDKMRGLLEYSHSLPFRDQNITRKINHQVRVCEFTIPNLPATKAE